MVVGDHYLHVMQLWYTLKECMKYVTNKITTQDGIIEGNAALWYRYRLVNATSDLCDENHLTYLPSNMS